MKRRALIIVLDSVGCGNAPDANQYGDEGANTLGHLFGRIKDLQLPNLFSIGLGGLLGLADSAPSFGGSQAFRLTERSSGKDTTTRHWELMGAPAPEPFFTCDSFSEELVKALEEAGKTEFIGNKVASGTEILLELGEQHLHTGHPIFYTSADSVMQITDHEERFGLERLQDLCLKAREILDQRAIRIGRVISRPFLGNYVAEFKRTSNRHDYSMIPGETTLNKLSARGVETVGVGKISDLRGVRHLGITSYDG